MRDLLYPRYGMSALRDFCQRRTQKFVVQHCFPGQTKTTLNRCLARLSARGRGEGPHVQVENFGLSERRSYRRHCGRATSRKPPTVFFHLLRTSCEESGGAGSRSDARHGGEHTCVRGGAEASLAWTSSVGSADVSSGFVREERSV